MATGPTRTDPHAERRGADLREARLAELVAELAPCDPEVALDAVRSGPDAPDPLEVVARALTGVRHGALEPQDRLRVAGFLRAPSATLPRRVPAAVVAEPADHQLVHHGSLRRWERTAGPDDADRLAVADDENVIDLRDRTSRFRRPGPL